MKQKQSGFTLIEIAIVLVIIGLLLGGVLKGQELINSAKVKNLATDFKNIPVYIYGYQDKYRSMPGDDIQAESHVGAATGHNGNGNGIINGTWLPATQTAETSLFWEHVRRAGLAAGSTDTAAVDFLPRNASGGRIGIQGGSTFSIANLKGSYVICSESILGKFARQLDTNLDDGNTTTGSVMVTAATAETMQAQAAAAASSNLTTADDETAYTVCMGF
ncbi:MAG: prepilin-type N-terminal cleavage/methylation domain-containing protein [Gammaproteobacteria bacterium]|nr:prepilin-type N-terminal cleavage/methylation domain-containing protein [Gammaproteobacteria bacterium]MBU1624871.1 prepilin-type N-terminal cleavage/methylation domain-containing protein [Gammaproteobacteria bacterium]MBU1982715.1 prepilin-type N-terminal cleavage/methylation domain-containing protein [Gammaproteobacteria bacterium]